MKNLVYRFATSGSFGKLLVIFAAGIFGLATPQTAQSWVFGGGGSGGWGSDNVVGNCVWDDGTSTLDGASYNIKQQGICTFTGNIKATNTSCTVDVTYNLGVAPQCKPQGKNFVVNINSLCKDFDATSGIASVTGTLSCPAINLTEQIGLGSKAGNSVGPFNKNDCSVFGGQTVSLLSHQLVFEDSKCTNLLADTTQTSNKACHADQGPVGPNGEVICKVNGGPTGGDTYSGIKHNDPDVVCRFNDPWQGTCTNANNDPNKDSGVVKGYFDSGILGPSGVGIDAGAIDPRLVELNGRPTTKPCVLKNGTLECTFASCVGGQFIAPGPNPTASMNAIFGTNNQEVNCGPVPVITR